MKEVLPRGARRRPGGLENGLISGPELNILAHIVIEGSTARRAVFSEIFDFV